MNNTYSIKSLLEKYKIEIPVIQRDYAQGRKGKEYVRKNFLEQIKSALDKTTETSLDFIYGNIENERFFPVDGQQRLTTLWLIYWYLSFKSGNLKEDYKTLENFSYETRESSRAFCKALCERMIEVSADTIEIIEYIKQQTWFYESWLNDPTISAMLRTIGGDSDSKEDCIESVFKDVDFENYYGSLDCVKFQLLVMGSEKLPVADDLYIKMNARGKMLSDFDNLKADLISYVRNIKPNNEEEKKLKDDLPKQIDTTWTDVIWDYTKKGLGDKFNGKIDRVFFSFINRFVVNEICLSDKFKVDDLENEYTKAFNKLYGAGLGSKSTANDCAVKYEGFENYKILTLDKLSKMNYLFNFLKDKAETIKEIEAALPNSDEDGEESISSVYSFIPKYDEKLELIATTQKERIYFLAICLFIKKREYFDETEYEKWMRVVRNLTENAGIDSVSAMVSCMRLINELSKILEVNVYDNVYTGLESFNSNKQDTRLYQQLEEEKEKAKKITRDNSFEDKIIEAEQYAFFNGTIRFLFYDETGNVDWANFDTKFFNVKKLFGKDNNVSDETITKFLKLFNGWSDIEGKYLFTSIGYHPRKSCWKRNILCDEKLKDKVHKFLLGSTNPAWEITYQDFLDSGFIKKIVKKSDNDKYRYTSTYTNAIHKDHSSIECVYFYDGRKEKCEQIKKLVDSRTIYIVDGAFNEYDNGYYWGMYVAFKYNNVEYRWYKQYGGNEDRIYKYENDVQVGQPKVWDKEALLDVLNEF
ncbi:MAG: DUF262 domain-containing protein [Clostridia bacterium]|nr:DUF262 domain-containing protein [Clostridia bacterium]